MGRSLASALTGITAAVVGVIANLAVYFALHTLFSDVRDVSVGAISFDVPVPGSLVWQALAVALIGCALIFGRRWTVLRTLGVCAVVGVVLNLLTGT